MSAPSKRRRISYYLSLPLVVAFVFLVVAQLGALQRADMVADLADRVAHEEAQDATAALRQLAAMPRPPVHILVGAATSADHAIAEEAQLLISKLLRHWQRQIETERRVATVARQLDELADSLARHQRAFSISDHRWMANTTRKILRLANRIPPHTSPLVAEHCDAVLAALSAREMSTATFVDRHFAVANQPVTPVSAPAPVAQIMNSAAGASQRDFVAYEVPPFTPATAASVSESQITGSDEEESSSRAQPEIAEEENQATRVLKWMHPMLRIAPATPINGVPSGGTDADSGPSPLSPTTPEVDADSTKMPFTDLDSRELLQRWLDAKGSQVLPVEEELTRRGFGRLSARLVEQLFSEDSEERLRLVDDVLTQPGVDARPWLLLLSDDAEADVRLLAVTIMATSDDALLIEKAWHVAISDRDPRIAGLAGRLRDRRESAQQR